jgi:hypothetical protein
MGIGASDYHGLPQLLDHLVINGRVRNPNWVEHPCPNLYNRTQVAGDGTIAQCPSWHFAEDNTATLSGVAGNYYTYGQLGHAARDEGAAVWLPNRAAAAGVEATYHLATSTPSLEVVARLGTLPTTFLLASTSIYVIGFVSSTDGNTMGETFPEAGCFFIASSTQRNWQATCKTSNSASTTIDTGVPTTTTPTGQGQFLTFRIDADANKADFWIKQATTSMKFVGRITSNIPTVGLNVGASVHRSAGVTALQFDIMSLNAWVRKITPRN